MAQLQYLCQYSTDQILGYAVEYSSNLLKFYSLPSVHLILGIVQVHFEK